MSCSISAVGLYTAVLLFAVGSKEAQPLLLPDPEIKPFSAVLPLFGPGDKALVNLGLVVTSKPAVDYGSQVLGMMRSDRWYVNESRYQFSPAYWQIDRSVESISIQSVDTELVRNLSTIAFVPFVGARDKQLRVVIFPEGESPDL